MKNPKRIRNKKSIFFITFIVTVILAYLFLMIPEEEIKSIIDFDDLRDDQLKINSIHEAGRYFQSGSSDCSMIDSFFSITDSIKIELNQKPFYTEDAIFDSLKKNFLILSALVTNCNYRLNDLIAIQTGIANSLKRQYRGRIFNKERFIKLYQDLLTYRIAIEDAIISLQKDNFISKIRGIDEPSDNPLSREAGIFLRSGDVVLTMNDDLAHNILRMRNEFQGSFPDASLVYVEDSTRNGFIMNSNVNKGAEIFSVTDFFASRNNRYMILRMSSADTLMLIDSLIPHKAAMLAYDEISNNKIRFDLENKTYSGDRLSNAELIYYYYRNPGMHLNITGIDISPVLYEVHPSLVEVFEVRESRVILNERLQELSIQILTDKFRNKEFEDFNIFLLPVARIVKLYSLIIESVTDREKEGPVPQDVSAREALKLWFMEKEYSKIYNSLEEKVNHFKSQNNRNPFYWELLSFRD
jgi:hypothetical protein